MISSPSPITNASMNSAIGSGLKGWAPPPMTSGRRSSRSGARAPALGGVRKRQQERHLGVIRGLARYVKPTARVWFWLGDGRRERVLNESGNRRGHGVPGRLRERSLIGPETWKRRQDRVIA